MPRAGELVGGKYRIVRLLGQGGMGAVYAAEHALSYKRVALKWVRSEYLADKQAMARLLREARACCRVRHPHIVDLYDVVSEEGLLFLVMEYLEGESLRCALDRESLAPYRAIELIVQAMRGALAVHRAGIVHRDIKPDNLFLALPGDGSRPVAKLIDFGISKLLKPDSRGPITDTGVVIGTLHYMSYEQLRGDRDLDGRSDVYAFGVLLYEALTGALPFQAVNAVELAMKMASSVPVPPRKLRSSISPALSGLILRALYKRREDRISLERLIDDLRPFAQPNAWLDNDEDPALFPAPRAFASDTTRTRPRSRERGAKSRRAGLPWVLAGAVLAGVASAWGVLAVLRPALEFGRGAHPVNLPSSPPLRSVASSDDRIPHANAPTAPGAAFERAADASAPNRSGVARETPEVAPAAARISGAVSSPAISAAQRARGGPRRTKRQAAARNAPSTRAGQSEHDGSLLRAREAEVHAPTSSAPPAPEPTPRGRADAKPAAERRLESQEFMGEATPRQRDTANGPNTSQRRVSREEFGSDPTFKAAR